MRPCGLRNLARPWGQLSFSLKAGQAAECVRGALAKRGLKSSYATLWAAGFGAPLGATFVWPQGRSGCGLIRGTLAQRGLKNNHAAPRAAGFGAPLGATFVWPQGRASCGLSPRHLGRKGAKKHSCNLAGCGIWRTLGGDGRLASRPDELRAAPAAPWPKGL